MYPTVFGDGEPMEEEFKFAALGFIRKPKPLIAKIEAGEIALKDVFALSQRDLNVQMQRGYLSLKNAWTVHGFQEGKGGGIKIDLTRASSRKWDSTAKYVLFMGSPVFQFHIPLDEYKRVQGEDHRGRKVTRNENKAIVPQAFQIIDDFLAGNKGIMWPYIDNNGSFGVTFEHETDGVLFASMVTVNVQSTE